MKSDCREYLEKLGAGCDALRSAFVSERVGESCCTASAEDDGVAITTLGPCGTKPEGAEREATR